MKNPNNLFIVDTTRTRIARGIGAIMLVSTLSACASEAQQPMYTDSQSPTQIDISNNRIEKPTPSIESHDDIEKNIPAGAIEYANLFGDNEQDVTEYRVYRKGNFIDLVPPVQDGIFSVILPNKNDNPSGYSFNGVLSTDEKGSILGDLLIGGHTNSGGDWIMNNIGGLELGDIQTFTFNNAIYKTAVTKITHIKKTGNVHAWPGFDKALGEDGAIFGCRLTKDADGNTVQSGDVTIIGIKIISAERNN